MASVRANLDYRHPRNGSAFIVTGAEIQMNFKRNLAVVIGINQYKNGVNPLQTAVPDAQKLSEILTEKHGYTLIHPDVDTNAAILNTEATLAQLKTLFFDILPNRIRPTSCDRLFIYFAGHGITRQVNEQGPQGFLVPQDANTNNCDSLLPMSELYDALNQLECRHLFVILDCCFAGMFRWASTRKVVLVPDEIHWEHYHRFIKYPAWQVITSAAHNQEALDYLDNRVTDTSAKHSPFAEALFEGLLDQKADLVPDGVITAAELYIYLRDYVEQHSHEKQTPGFWPLAKHDRGEYIFQLVPEEQLTLKSAPKLEKDNNPYRGLESFDEKHAGLFFGRENVIDELVTHISAPGRQFIVVDGISGSGKSSLVKAGLISRLKEQHSGDWHVFAPIRPGTDAYHALACAILPAETNPQDIKQASEMLKTSPETLPVLIEAWSQLHPQKQLLLVIDQFEELITLAPKRTQNTDKRKWGALTRGRRFEWQPPAQASADRPQWQAFTERLAQAIERCPQLCILVTLRSDFAPRFQSSALSSRWAEARFLVRPMRSDELRQAVIGPANEMALYFEPASLVDTLVDEVAQTPGALPLLSFALSELYLKLHSEWTQEGKEDRGLSVGDEFYGRGGIAGLLAKRANEEYDQLPDDGHRRTMRQVLLRMVEIEGGEAVKRRVLKQDLLYVDAQENKRVETVLARLDCARLIIGGNEAGEAYIEPAHDYLVRGWDRLQEWIQQEQETLLLQRLLTPATKNWHRTKRDLWNGNSRLTLLKQIRKSRDNWLNQLEMLFVQSSLNRKRLNIGSRLSFMGLVAIGGTVFWLANDQRITEFQQFLLDANARIDKTVQQLQHVSAQKAEYQVQYDETVEDLEIANEQVGQAKLDTEEARAQTKEEEKKTQAAAKLAQENYASAQRNAVNQFSATAKLFIRDRKPIEAMVYAISAANISRSDGLWEDGSPPSTVPVNLLNVIESNLERNVFTVPAAAVSETTLPEPNDALPEEATPENVALNVATESAFYVSAIASDGQTIISGNHQGDIHFWQASSPSASPTDSRQLGDVKVREIFTTAKEEPFVWTESGASATITRLNKEDKPLPTEEIKRFENESRPVSVAIATDSQTIAVGSRAKTLTVLDDQGSELWPEVQTELEAIRSVAIASNGETVVVAGVKNNKPQVQIWTQTTLEKPVVVEADELKVYDTITAVTLSSDGQNIVLVGDDATGNSHVNVWDLAGAKRTHQPMETAGSINQLSVTQGGNILATVPEPKAALFKRSAVYVWSIKGKRLLNKTVEGEVKDAAIAINGTTIVLSSVADSQNTLHVWEGSQRQAIAQVVKYYGLSAVSNAEVSNAKVSNAEVSNAEVSEATVSEATVSEAEASGAVTTSSSTVELTGDEQIDTVEADATDSSAQAVPEPKKTTEESAESLPAAKSIDEAETAINDSDRAETKASLNTTNPNEASSDQAGGDTSNPDDETRPETDSSEVASAEENDLDADSSENSNSENSNSEEDDSDKAIFDEPAITEAPAEEATIAPADRLNPPGDEQATVPNEEEQNDTALQLALRELVTDSAQTLISVSPGGKTVVIGENATVDGKKNYQLRVQNAQSSELLSEQASLLDEGFLPLEAEIHSLSISEAENSATENKARVQRVAITLKADKQDVYSVKVFDVKTGQFVGKPIVLRGSQVAVQISPDGQALVSTTTQQQNNRKYTSEIKLWELASLSHGSDRNAEPTATLKKSQSAPGEISALAISTDGNWLMTAHNQGFDNTSTDHKYGGEGSLTVWDISPQAAGARDLIKKKTIPAGGYISAIALSMSQQEVALITHHAKRPTLSTGKENLEEMGANHIISKVKTWTWEGQPTSQTLNLGRGKIMQFIGLMPDGENIVVGGHEVAPWENRSAGLSPLRPTIRIFNKQNRQLFDLDWAVALSTEATNNARDKSEEILDYPERLTALVVGTDGKYIFSGMRHLNQLGVIRWNLELENLLQASCDQIKHHPILYRPTAESQEIGSAAQSACNQLAQPEAP